jgi:hypothetical protein
MTQYRQGRIATIERIENGWVVTYRTWTESQKFFATFEELVAWLKDHSMREAV